MTTPKFTDSQASELLAAFLADRDVQCPRCGYNLRGITSGRCPECGDPLELRVGLVWPKQKAMLTGLIGLALGCGLNGLLLIYGLLIALVYQRFYSDLDDFFIYNTVALLVEGLAMGLWLARWRQVHRCSALSRWTLATGCWLLSLVNVVAFSNVIS